MIPTIGLMFVELSTVGLMYFNINFYYFLIPMIVQGLVGDTFSLVQFVMSYIRISQKTTGLGPLP